LPKVDKLIVTNRKALRTKYGTAWKRIEEAWDELVRADDTRGVVTQVVALDDPAEMPDPGHAVKRAGNDLQAKVAVDTVFRAYQPRYLMILGGVDIVPQQQLRNPKHSPDDMSDTVPSDLPYACENPQYSRDIAQFTGPTRAIGRLPDVTGYSNPAYLEGLLRTAAAAVPQDAPGGNHVFALSTKKWRTLTETTLAGPYPHSVPTVRTSPRKGPDWPDDDLKLPLHFINCHGGQSDCRFYGDSGVRSQTDAADPIAHDSACIAKRLAEGTVTVAECCFGAQLYDPADAGGVAGICTTYLANGAYAFFGSSGVAYGGVTCNESADVVCGLFLQELLTGAPTGSAALRAVQKYVDACHRPLDPVDLKTIAQFNLFGDPSIKPFLPAGTSVPAEAEVPAGGRPDPRLPAKRPQREDGLVKKGEELGRLSAASSHLVQVPHSHEKIHQILRFAGVKGWRLPELRSFDVAPVPEPPDGAAAPPAYIHVLTRPSRGRHRPFPDIELIIAREVDERIVSCRRVSSR
jgi:hypothetical protein